VDKKLVRIVPGKWINQAEYSRLRTHLANKDGLPLCKKRGGSSRYEYVNGTGPTCQKCQIIELRKLEKKISKLINYWEKEIRVNVEKESRHSSTLRKMSFSGKMKYSYWKRVQAVLDELKEMINYEN